MTIRQETNIGVRGPYDFIPWMEAHRDEVPWKFHLQPKRHHVRVFLDGLHPAIAITVSTHDLRVTVDQDGETLDTLLWLEMSPACRGSAYVCTLCEPTSAKRFANLTEMREDHLYAPFLNWCQKTLAHATHLELLHTPGVSAARLFNMNLQTGEDTETDIFHPTTYKFQRKTRKLFTKNPH